MIFTYWVEFSDDGEIAELHKSKVKGCKEYVVKLIPIDRKIEDLNERAAEFVKSAEKASKSMKKFQTEFEKTTKDLRRIKL
jgi:DNA repair exonuclease SbcCD ATPase subunit